MREVWTSGEPTQILKNIPEKSGTDYFSREICGNPLYTIYTPVTLTGGDSTDLPQTLSYRTGPDEVQMNLTCKKKLKGWGSFNVVPSQLKVAIPTGQCYQNLATQNAAQRAASVEEHQPGAS